MDLGLYLHMENLTVGEMARALGFSRTYFNGIITGRVIPSYKAALAIELYTNGVVTTHDVLRRGADRQEYLDTKHDLKIPRKRREKTKEKALAKLLKLLQES